VTLTEHNLAASRGTAKQDSFSRSLFFQQKKEAGVNREIWCGVGARS